MTSEHIRDGIMRELSVGWEGYGVLIMISLVKGRGMEAGLASFVEKLFTQHMLAKCWLMVMMTVVGGNRPAHYHSSRSTCYDQLRKESLERVEYCSCCGQNIIAKRVPSLDSKVASHMR